jgi:molybdate/tungstate transport system substrate-binding protein
MRPYRLFPTLLIVLIILLVVSGIGCVDDSAKTQLKVIPAGSLLIPFETIEKEFETEHPEVDVLLEGHGSIQAVRQVTDLGRRVDVVAVADVSLIPDMMFRPVPGEEGNYTDWYIQFAQNEVVIAYTNTSVYAGEINESNWYEVLTRPEVRVGFSNPMLDACGYRAFMVSYLAEHHYQRPNLFMDMIGNHLDPVPEVRNNGVVEKIILPELFEPSDEHIAVRDGSIYLLSLLDAGGIDYAFEYLSVARAHGLCYIDLPSQVDLGSPDYTDVYRSVEVELGFRRFDSIGNVRVGAPIVYAITIPQNAPNPDLARDFVDYVVERFSRGEETWPKPLLE